MTVWLWLGVVIVYVYARSVCIQVCTVNGCFVKCSVVLGNAGLTIRSSSYDNNNCDFETVVQRNSEGKNDCSPFSSKNNHHDSSTSSKFSKQAYDCSPNKLNNDKFRKSKKYVSDQYEIYRELLAIHGSAMHNVHWTKTTSSNISSYNGTIPL